MPDHRPQVGAVIAVKYRAEGMPTGEAIVLARMALDALDEAGWRVVPTLSNNSEESPRG